MLGQLGTVWNYRHFWLSLVVMDLRTRYRRSVLGVGWSLMNPVMMTIVFCVVFGAWLPSADWRTHGPYFLAGLTLFDFIRTSALTGCQTFFRNEAYIRQCPLPLAIYTLRTVLGACVHFLIGLSVVILAIFVLMPHQRVPFFQIAWVLIPSVLLLLAFCWAISVLASFATVYFQDSQQLLEVLFQVFFFLTPIMFKPQMLDDRGLHLLLQLNPAYTFFELIRSPLLTGELPTVWVFEKGMIIVAMFGGMALGAIASLEKKLIFHL